MRPKNEQNVSKDESLEGVKWPEWKREEPNLEAKSRGVKAERDTKEREEASRTMECMKRQLQKTLEYRLTRFYVVELGRRAR